VTTARTWAALVVCAISGLVHAADAVVAAGAWARATPPGLSMGAAYVTLTGGATADTLVAARLDGVARIEFHESLLEGGIARMRQVPSVTIPPHATMAFAPQGRHLMLVDLARPLVAGERRTLVLELERAGEIRVELDVAPVTATGAPGHH
jgi:copper(I)-binding protein